MNGRLRQDVIDYQWGRLLPLLQKMGYTGKVKRTTHPKRSGIFSYEVFLGDELNVVGMAKATLWQDDAYPRTSKQEAVLHVWGQSGSDGPKLAKDVAMKLARLGIPARATTFQKYHVVAFDPGNWMETPWLDELPQEKVA